MRKITSNVLLVIILVISFAGCKKKTESSDSDIPVITVTPIPTTPEQIEASQALSRTIGSAGAKIITDNINRSINNNSPINPQSIADQIKTIPNVKNAYLNETGSAVIIQKSDNYYFSMLIGGSDNMQLYPKAPINTTTSNSVANPPQQFSSTTNTSMQFPTSNKALILAPFQRYFKEDLKTISTLLTLAGYQVTCLPDDKATLAKFRGDFLQDYGIIYIATHGMSKADFKLLPPKFQATSLFTGELINEPTYSALFPKDLQTLIDEGKSDDDGMMYFKVCSNFIQSTFTKKLPNSWVFLDACESAKDKDLSDMFLNNGAAAFNGYNNKMNNYFSSMMTVKIFSIITNGNFREIPSQLQLDLGIQKISLAGVPESNISSLVSIYKENPNFAIAPTELAVRFNSFNSNPSFGYSGDIITFNATSTPYDLNQTPVSKVVISSSDKMDFQMTSVLNDQSHFSPVWNCNIVSIPNPNFYPRIDTYIYKAFDKNNNYIQYQFLSRTFIAMH